MNKTDNKYISFLITAIVTSIVALVLCLIVELSLMFKCESSVTRNELNTANLLQFATIDQLEKRLILEPNNHVVMIKLAQIYEGLDKIQDANKYYTDALKYSYRSNYALYNYGLFCAKRNLYTIATALSEEISGNKNDKNIIKYKSEIYEAMADSMMKNSEYEPAVKAYQISYKYAKNVKDKHYLKNITDKFAYAYVKLADILIEDNRVPEAISALNNSIKIEETPLAKYKLALVYFDLNKVVSQKYMEEVFYSEPYLVNPYIYNSLLTSLINEAKDENNNSVLHYYTVKYNRFKDTLEDSYLYKTDISISNSQIITKKDKRYLEFNLKNNSKYKIDQLYLDIDLFLNTKRYKISKKIIHLAHTLPPYAEIRNYQIELPSNIEFVDIADHNYLILKYFAKKSVKAPNTLIKIDALNF